MAMVVKNNLGAVRTVNTLNKNSKAQSKSLAKTSSGMKINSADDDASGYSISERMRVRIRALDQANQNAQNDAALMKTAGGAVDNTVEILRALKEKAIDAANDSNTDEDRLIIQKEAHQLIDQINDNALVQFNGKYLINGTKNNALVSTKTIMVNQEVAIVIPGAVTTNLTKRDGSALGIHNSDIWQLSWTTNGKTNSATGIVSETGNSIAQMFLTANLGQTAALVPIMPNDGKLDLYETYEWAGNHASYRNLIKDKFGQDVYVEDKSYGGMAIFAAYAGVDKQLDGFTITITDDKGNERKDVNAALKFNLFQRAENATGDNSLTFQIGSEANVAIKVALSDMRAHSLGLEGTQGEKLLFCPKENANAAISVIESALTTSLDQSTSIGAVQQRLEYTQTNLTTSSENVQAAESTIRDADMAKEMTEFTKNNVLMQAAQAMLAQANQSSSSVISLLQ